MILRPGKTAKDHKSGAWARHNQNQALRRAWNKEYMTGAKSGGLRVIPYPKIGI